MFQFFGVILPTFIGSTIFSNHQNALRAGNMDRQLEAVSRFLSVFDTRKFDVRLIHIEGNNKPFMRQLTKIQILEYMAFLKAKNVGGYNVYIRPIGYEFVLVDDVKRATLAKAAELKPAALIETSPNNFQLWYILPEVPNSREQAKAICLHFAELLNADKGSAEPDHLGRLAGFTNRKPKYCKEDGQYPFVNLIKVEPRYTTIDPNEFPAVGVLVDTKNRPKSHARKGTINGRSRSEEDFNLACMLVIKGFDDAYIYQRLEKVSEKAKEKSKPEDYLKLTIENARNRVTVG